MQNKLIREYGRNSMPVNNEVIELTSKLAMAVNNNASKLYMRALHAQLLKAKGFTYNEIKNII